MPHSGYMCKSMYNRMPKIKWEEQNGKQRLLLGTENKLSMSTNKQRKRFSITLLLDL